MTLTKTTSTQCEFTFASISDIHLAHPRTDTYHILENLRRAFPDDSETAKLDIVFLAGDVFDRLMSLPQEEVDALQDWIAFFLMTCAKHNILVRVLEGTPSHDWRQSKQFVNINNSLRYPAKLKYVDTLSIEVIEELGGVSVLYVPDEWNDDAEITLTQVRELLSIHGLDQVDMGCMHGAFDYQLPIQSVKNHDSETYLSLVKHYIVIGHVHNRSEKIGMGGSVILAQGSFDRLSHGDESSKGHYRGVVSSKGNHHWFVENEGARIYKTLDCRGMGISEVISFLANYEDAPSKSNYRLLLERNSVLSSGIGEIRKRFPQFNITTQLDDLKTQEEMQTNTLTIGKLEVKPVTITASNIDNLIKDFLSRRPDVLNGKSDKDLLDVLGRYKE